MVKLDGWSNHVGYEWAEVCGGSHTSCIKEKMPSRVSSHMSEHKDLPHIWP